MKGEAEFLKIAKRVKIRIGGRAGDRWVVQFERGKMRLLPGSEISRGEAGIRATVGRDPELAGPMGIEGDIGGGG